MVQVVDQGDQHARPAAQTVQVKDDRDVALAQDIETDGQVRWVVGDCRRFDALSNASPAPVRHSSYRGRPGC